jgi:hypothetical protein
MFENIKACLDAYEAKTKEFNDIYEEQSLYRSGRQKEEDLTKMAELIGREIQIRAELNDINTLLALAIRRDGLDIKIIARTLLAIGEMKL